MICTPRFDFNKKEQVSSVAVEKSNEANLTLNYARCCIFISWILEYLYFFCLADFLIKIRNIKVLWILSIQDYMFGILPKNNNFIIAHSSSHLSLCLISKQHVLKFQNIFRRLQFRLSLLPNQLNRETDPGGIFQKLRAALRSARVTFNRVCSSPSTFHRIK